MPSWVGTNGGDSYYGSEGDDTLSGLNGDDYLVGEGGDDNLFGGDGNDGLGGGEGDDILSGGEGNDQLGGGNGYDVLLGGGGADRLEFFRYVPTGPAPAIAYLDDYADMDGGSGDDFLFFQLSGVAQTWDLTSGFTGIEHFWHFHFNPTEADILIFRPGQLAEFSELVSNSGAIIVRFSEAAHLDLSDMQYLSIIGFNGKVATEFELFDAANEIVFNSGYYGSAVGWNDNNSFQLTVRGKSQADIVTGANWTTLYGAGGDDILTGGQSTDGDYYRAELYGQDGNDRLTGGIGHDRIEGGAGIDVILAGGGDDVITDDPWDPVTGTIGGSIDGGDGVDTVTLEGVTITRVAKADGTVIWQTGGALPALLSGEPIIVSVLRGGTTAGTVSMTGVERLTGITTGSILFTTGDNRVDFTQLGESQSAAVYAMALADYPTGLYFAWGGNDVVRLPNASAFVGMAAWNFDTMFFAGDGNDRVTGGTGNDEVSGGDGRDQLLGGAGADQLYGDGDNDLLDGGEQNDALHGGGGRDTLTGGNGDDTLDGGDGNDQLDGGGGTGDVAEFAGNFDSYRLHFDERGRLQVIDRFGGGGIDTLTGVESLDFADRFESLAFSSDEYISLFLRDADFDKPGQSSRDLIDAAWLLAVGQRKIGTNSLDANLRNAEYYLLGVQSILGGGMSPLTTGISAPIYDLLKGMAANIAIGSWSPVEWMRADPNIPNSAPGGTVWSWAGMRDAIRGEWDLHLDWPGYPASLQLPGPAKGAPLAAGAVTETAYMRDGGSATETSTIDGTTYRIVHVATLPGGSTGLTVFDSLGGTYSLTAGNDMVFSAKGGTVSLGGGNDVAAFTLAVDVSGGSGDDTIALSDFADIADGGAGNDVLMGGAGADRLTGGTGDDAYGVDDAGDVVIEKAGEGTDTVVATIDYALGANVENLVLAEQAGAIDGTGNGADNMLIGNAAANLLFGLGGNDTLIGGGGDDRLDGGAGVDTADYATATAAVTVSLALATAQNTGGAGTDTLTGIERLTGSAYDDALTGNAQANQLDGGAGDDLLDGGAGADRMIGGTGDDLFRIDSAGDVAVELADEGDDLVESSVSIVLGANIERLTLVGAAAINGTGNGLDNVILGNGAANRLNGGAGADRMEGGAGNDRYVVDDAGDVVVEKIGGGTDSIDSSISFSLAGLEVENLTLTALTAFDATGNAFANVLTGNNNANVLDGGAGADEMRGGNGNDTYYVDNIGDKAIENASAGSDRVYASVTFSLAGQYTEALTLTGTAAIDGTGNSQNNTITGNDATNVLVGGAGDDRLDGGAGADTLRGGLGADTFVIDQAGDKAIENAGEGNDTVEAWISYSLAGQNIEYLKLMGTADLNGTGNSLANTLTGNSGNNVLNGGGGADEMYGGAGDDRFVVDNVGDKVFELNGEGTDLVESSVTFSLAGQFLENLTLTGTAAINGTGNSFANILTGNNAGNLLNGGTGDDQLHGGLGADTLTGGAGVDSFWFETALGASNVDDIKDFAAVDDTIYLDRSIFSGITANGALAGGAFYQGSAAHDADDRIIYNKATGNLYYDADGAGGAAAVLFAHVTANTSLTAADFFAVP